MKTVARTGPYTYDDFCQLVREDQKADLIDGVIYMASPENTDPNDLFVWLHSQPVEVFVRVGAFLHLFDIGTDGRLRHTLLPVDPATTEPIRSPPAHPPVSYDPARFPLSPVPSRRP